MEFWYTDLIRVSHLVARKTKIVVGLGDSVTLLA